jgi:transposase-like protein
VPAEPTQRRYEALRAYRLEGVSVAMVAARFGYSTETLASMVRDFRAGRRDFFVTPRPGPKVAPAKEAARSRIVELRREGHSAYEIAEVLAAEGTPLNRTGVAEVLAEEGLPRIWPRPHAERGLPRRDTLPRAKVIDFAELAERAETKLAGLLLVVPDLVALDLPAMVAAAGDPAAPSVLREGEALLTPIHLVPVVAKDPRRKGCDPMTTGQRGPTEAARLQMPCPR